MDKDSLFFGTANRWERSGHEKNAHIRKMEYAKIGILFSSAQKGQEIAVSSMSCLHEIRLALNSLLRPVLRRQGPCTHGVCLSWTAYGQFPQCLLASIMPAGVCLTKSREKIYFAPGRAPLDEMRQG